MGGHYVCMASPPDAHDDTTHDNASHGDVYGQLLQARDIHGGVTVHAPQAPPPPLADVSLDPPRLATAVRGREELLEVLGEAMEAGAAVPHVLTGPGGFGKTTVAAALAEQARVDGRTVFWVRPGNVAASMIEAAVETGGSRREAEQVKGTQHQAARWVWRHLDSAPRPWLLVIDNADRPEELDPRNRPGDQLGWMRASPGGFVLVTSRVDDPAQWAPAQVHRIEELEASAAAAALADHAGLTEPAGAEWLAERLGGVPLALFLAGRILATYRVLLPDANALLDRLNEDIGTLDELAAPLVTGNDSERKLLSGVWDLSLRLVAEREPKAEPLLRLLSVLGPNSTPVPLRRLPLSELNGGVLGALDEAGLARAVNALVVHGLVTVVSPLGETSLRLHPLVSETVRTGFGEEDLPLVDEAERLLARQRDRDLLLEMNALNTITRIHARLRPGEFHFVVDGAVSASRAFLRLGVPKNAEKTVTRIVESAKTVLGQTHPSTLRARHHLAEAVLAQGRVDEAEEAFRSLHQDRVRALGSDHVDTLETLYQRGLVSIRGERWEEAAEILGSVRQERVRMSGEEDPLALFAAQNLAYVTMRRGDPTAAESEFRCVHTVRKRVLGPDHHMTADAAFYVARASQEKGDAESALIGFTEVLRVWSTQLGQDHPQVKMVEQRMVEVEGLVAQRPMTP